HVEVGCRPEINNNTWPAIFLKGAYAISNAVCAYFARIVSKDRQPSFNTRFDKERLVVEIAFAEDTQNPVHGRHDRSDNDSADLAAFYAFALQKVLYQDAVFVGSLSMSRADAPCRPQVVGPSITQQRINRNDRVCVVYVQYQKHVSEPI